MRLCFAVVDHCRVGDTLGSDFKQKTIQVFINMSTDYFQGTGTFKKKCLLCRL